ncbi:BICD family-like cargo adapter 2 isoform X2 [Crotalus tigris]|uniref:BICD family-like cargo adapter 2 isoform X2 n=1 Tax=Crotalus tigris TaxID=88082 RepID=UPI00192F6E29|nr:BICD family-like cargo adapter 2 isoform X2 [Crotalus tigris]
MTSSRNPEEEHLRSPFPLTPPPALRDEYYPFGDEGQPPFRGDAAAAGATGEGDPDDTDLGVLLQRKEQDLLLAAELGKMLLERNEELERRYDELMKEHLEVKEHLEQEKHELRRHLKSGRAEFETRTAELEADWVAARAQLGQKRLEQQDTSRESSQAVLDLSEQNQRLVEQLSQVTHLEQQLQEDLAVLRAEHRTLSLCNAEHAARMQSLQAENRLLQERKQDMEKQIRRLREENESIQVLVDTLHDNLLLLRKESCEKQLRFKQVEAEAEELRTANRRLQHQVKDLKEEIRLHELDTSVTSIQSEIESSLGDAPGAPGQTPKKVGKGDHPTTGYCNRHEYMVVAKHPNFDYGDAAVVSITHGIHKTGSTPKKASPRLEENISEYTKRVSALSHQQQDILAQKEMEIAKLQDQVTLQYVELSGLKSEIENQRRLYQESNRDKALKLAVADRDEAIFKKGEIELELAKISLERDSLSQQLLRVIRQKMALTQELEAWQDDIQYIIHQQLLQKQREERHCLTPPPKPPTQGFQQQLANLCSKF